MDIKIQKSELKGSISAPASKSYSHRALICAMLSNGKTTLDNLLICDDTLATIRACRQFGVRIENSKEKTIVESTGALIQPSSVIDCRGSGTTLRIMMAIGALAPDNVTLMGNSSLNNRPIRDLMMALAQLDVQCLSLDKEGYPPVIVGGGGIKGGKVEIRGDISSQYISALLMSCPKAYNPTSIILTTNLESRPYVQMTLEVLRKFGIEINHGSSFIRFDVPPMQEFVPCNYAIEGDYSSAAYLLVAGCLAGNLKVMGLKNNSLQGDNAILGILDNMGAKITYNMNGIKIKTSELKAIDIDCTHIPDLVPILAVLATQANGTTSLRNLGRLRIKESDRLEAITTELKKMGADINVKDDIITINGGVDLNGATLETYDDHRIAMAGTIAGMVAKGNTIIKNIECIEKSYPMFISDMKYLGATIDDI